MKSIISKFFHIFSLMLNSIKIIENWWIIFSILLNNSKKEVFLKLRDNTALVINNNLLDIVVILENFNENNPYLKFKKNELANSTIIDIGSNIGAFTIYASKQYPFSKIFSFEPDHINYEKLLKNISLNKITNVVASNHAVGKNNGIVKLYSDEFGKFGTVGSSLTKIGPKSTNVKCDSLEEILNANNIKICDLLKVDCEGGEYDIILSSNKKILQNINSIAMEYHNINGHSGIELKKFLEDIGYDTIICPNTINAKYGFIYATKIKDKKL